MARKDGTQQWPHLLNKKKLRYDFFDIRKKTALKEPYSEIQFDDIIEYDS